MVSSATPVPEPSAEQALLSLLSCRPASDAKTNQHYVDRFRDQIRADDRRALAAARASEGALQRQIDGQAREIDRLRTQVRFLLEQVRRKDAASGAGNRALAEFLAENSEPEPQTPLPERHCGRPSLHLPHRIIQDRRAYHCCGAAARDAQTGGAS